METSTPSLAAKLYKSLDSSLQTDAAKAAGKAEDSPSAAFANTVRSFAETMREAETTAVDGMMGKADPQSVVTAIASAEIAVQSAVAIRDKVVESYQEILRMPV